MTLNALRIVCAVSIAATCAISNSTTREVKDRSEPTLNASESELDENTFAALQNLSGLKSADNVHISRAQIYKLLKAAEDFSPAMRETNFAVAAANNDIDAAKGARQPQLTLVGQSVRSDGDIPSASRATGKPSINLQINYPLYDWGRIEANIQGREQSQISAQERARLVSRQTAVEAIGVCLELRKQKAISKANTEYLNELAGLAEKIRKIVNEDTGRASELLQVRSRYLQGESQAEQIRSKVREISARLERVLGTDRGELCNDIEAALLDAPNEQTIPDLIKDLPLILQLEAEYQLAKANTAQLNAIRKPQVTLRAEHSPLASGVTNDYAQTISISAAVPLYDGNTLKSSERAAIERESATFERIAIAKNQLSSDLREKIRLAEANLKRAEDFIKLLEVNERVRNDFYLQWAALGRRSLFELLSIQLEQLSLRTGYFAALYDGITAISNVSGTLGRLDYQHSDGRNIGR